MTGSAKVTVNTLPAAYQVTGGGSYCSGGTGVAIGLNNSSSGVSYQLMLGTTSDRNTFGGNRFGHHFWQSNRCGHIHCRCHKGKLFTNDDWKRDHKQSIRYRLPTRSPVADPIAAAELVWQLVSTILSSGVSYQLMLGATSDRSTCVREMVRPSVSVIKPVRVPIPL